LLRVCEKDCVEVSALSAVGDSKLVHIPWVGEDLGDLSVVGDDVQVLLIQLLDALGALGERAHKLGNLLEQLARRALAGRVDGLLGVAH
jgi:hypothetical protein